MRRKPKRVDLVYVKLLQQIVDMNRYVTLVADVMFACGLPFMITLSQGIQFITVQLMLNETTKELCSLMKQVISLYKHAGFIKQTVLMENLWGK